MRTHWFGVSPHAASAWKLGKKLSLSRLYRLQQIDSNTSSVLAPLVVLLPRLFLRFMTSFLMSRSARLLSAGMPSMLRQRNKQSWYSRIPAFRSPSFFGSNLWGRQSCVVCSSSWLACSCRLVASNGSAR